MNALEINNRGTNAELHTVLKDRVVNHRNRFVRIFKNRYLEMLPSLITYKHTKATSIDFLKLEVALMYNLDVVIGEAKNGIIQILGFATSRKTSTNPIDLVTGQKLSKDDIKFIIPDYLIPDEMVEITSVDNYQTGNFVVIRNKTLNYVSDYEIIEHFTEELAEVVVSRYSLTMQAKIQTFFLGEEGDESMNKLVTDLYLGAPIVKASPEFEPKDSMIHMQNDSISQNFAELKREYQNKIGELNNMLGINSLAVEKSSGVSDVEAKSNRSFITSVANIKLESRKNSFKGLNERYNYDIEPVYNDIVESELGRDIYSEEGETE